MPFLKALALASVAFPLASATDSLPARTESGISPSVHPEIVQVRCLTGAGTAFYTGPNTLISVDHVTKNQGCFVGGKPFTVRHVKGDFSILHVEEPAKHWLAIDCKGFVAGKTYTAWGYARGLLTLTSIDSEARGDVRFGFSRLWGVFHWIPGQSGGPVIDPATGKAVGTVNVYDHRAGDSGSIELKGTAACNF